MFMIDRKHSLADLYSQLHYSEESLMVSSFSLLEIKFLTLVGPGVDKITANTL